MIVGTGIALGLVFAAIAFALTSFERRIAALEEKEKKHD
jgi:hypothetical protein